MNDRNALRAGIFMLASIAIIIAVIVAVTGVERLTEPRQHRQVTFKLSDDVGGLRVGDDVRVGGFKVGRIESIDLISEPQPAVVVNFSMPAKYILKQGARIGVQGTLTGTSWLNIDDLGAGAALPLDEPLVGRPSPTGALITAMSEIAEQARTVTLPKVNQTLGSFDHTAQSIRERIEPIVQRYFVVADRAAEMMIEVRDLIGDTKGDFRGTIAHLNAATGKVEEKLPRILDQVDTALTKVHTAIDSTNAALIDARQTMNSAKAVVVGNRAKLDGMIASLKTTGDNLKHASAEIRRSPWRLLYKPGAGEMANLNLYDSARQFADGAAQLSDAALALRDALGTPDVDPQRVQKLVEHLDQTFTHFNKVEAQLWSQVKE